MFRRRLYVKTPVNRYEPHDGNRLYGFSGGSCSSERTSFAAETAAVAEVVGLQYV